MVVVTYKLTNSVQMRFMEFAMTTLSVVDCVSAAFGATKWDIPNCISFLKTCELADFFCEQYMFFAQGLTIVSD